MSTRCTRIYANLFRVQFALLGVLNTLRVLHAKRTVNCES